MLRAFDAEPRSIALVRLRTGLGDLLCTIPALRALRARLPRAHVALVTFDEMRPVVERMGEWVDELLPFPGYPGIPERPPRAADIPAFFERARQRRFDLALQMYGGNAAANEVTARLGAACTGGFVLPGTAPIEPSTHLPYPGDRHEVWRHLDLMCLLGAPPRGDHLEFPVSSEDVRHAHALIREAGLEPGRFCVLHPGATSPSRRWPVERFAAVGAALVRRGLRVAVTGVTAESDITGSLVAAMRGGAVDLGGRTTLGSFAALLREARILVSGDTGAAHLAAALAVPRVTIFLSGDPRRWAGLDGKRQRVARTQVECNPCPHLSCPIDHRCAERLGAGAVIGELDRLLATDGEFAPAREVAVA